MTESMLTVALIVGDPAHEDLQLNETSLAAAARTIRVHSAVIHGRWDSGRRLSPLSGGQPGQPRSFVFS
ncbi:MAG: hypothetical protein WAK82_44650 [Streptosporangiaceae bacterium]